MASDIVRDLELYEVGDDEDVLDITADPQRMAGMRACLACQHLCASFSTGWPISNPLPYQQWTVRCCDVLMSVQETLEHDSVQTLVWLVRLEHIAEETLALFRRQRRWTDDDQQQATLLLKGLEAQLQEWQAQIPARLLSQSNHLQPQQLHEPTYGHADNYYSSSSPHGKPLRRDRPPRSPTPQVSL